MTVEIHLKIARPAGENLRQTDNKIAPPLGESRRHGSVGPNQSKSQTAS